MFIKKKTCKLRISKNGLFMNQKEHILKKRGVGRNQLIKNAKFSGYYFYMYTNIKEGFQICISVPLITFFSFPNILDPVNNFVPKVLMTYTLTFFCQVTAIIE